MGAIAFRPLAGYIGARVEGVALSETVDDDLAATLRTALFEHLILVFPEQYLDLARQKEVTEIFGPLRPVPYIEPMAGEPQVIAVLKKAEERNVGVFGGEWHSDFSFLKAPPAGSVLSAVEIPPYGGDTLWASQIAAYESLPTGLKDLIEGRDAVHTGAPYGVKHAPPQEARSGASIKMVRGDPAADRETFHPAVRTHPESGRKALFVNPIYTTRLDGLSEADSRPILERLFRHATRPDITCRHRWSAGDLVVWDNRTTLHYALNDYDGVRRLLYRTTFGDREPAHA
ncbi:MAG: TauD/TfdA family dioxygenase [Pseudomonadota bacterium]